MARRKVDRELKASFTLPEKALQNLRKQIAENVAAGVEDGFKLGFDKKKGGGKGSSDSGKETGSDIKDFGETVKKSGKEVGGLKSGLASLSKTVGLVMLALQAFMKIMEAVETRSKQLITQDSLFTDKSIMDLMQRTGQSAVGATATQRSLTSLGLDLSDIQEGKVTSAQMEAFQELQKEHEKSLQMASFYSAGMNKAWQNMSLHFSTEMSKLGDTLVTMLGESGVIEPLAEAFKEIFDAVVGGLQTFIPLIIEILKILAPLLTAFGNIIKHVFEYLQPTIGVIVKILSFLEPIAKGLNDVLNVVFTIYDSLFGWLKIFNVDNGSARREQEVASNTAYQNTQTNVTNNNYSSTNLFTNDHIFVN